MCSVCSVGHKKPKFNDQPFAYHQEIELEITTLTNLGSGLGRVDGAFNRHESRIQAIEGSSGPALRNLGEGGWVVMVPFTLPGERVRARVFRNQKNFSEADLDRRAHAFRRTGSRRRCPLFGALRRLPIPAPRLSAEQLAWKQPPGRPSCLQPHGRHRGLSRRAWSSPSPRELRLPLENHAALQSAARSRRADSPIGFLRQGTRFDIVDVPRCPIATAAINEKPHGGPRPRARPRRRRRPMNARADPPPPRGERRSDDRLRRDHHGDGR